LTYTVFSDELGPKKPSWPGFSAGIIGILALPVNPDRRQMPDRMSTFCSFIIFRHECFFSWREKNDGLNLQMENPGTTSE